VNSPTHICLCVLCVLTKHEILQHLVNEHFSDLAKLQISAIKQGKSTLLRLLESTVLDGSEMSTSSLPEYPSIPNDEEEVPPLPPPLPYMRDFTSPSRDQPYISPLPGSPVSDAPLPNSLPSTPLQSDGIPQYLYSPISDTPLPTSPADTRPPARESRDDVTRSLRQRREEEKKALRAKYTNNFAAFTDDSINEDQWGEFCASMDLLCEELISLVSHKADQQEVTEPGSGK